MKPTVLSEKAAAYAKSIAKLLPLHELPKTGALSFSRGQLASAAAFWAINGSHALSQNPLVIEYLEKVTDEMSVGHAADGEDLTKADLFVAGQVLVMSRAAVSGFRVKTPNKANNEAVLRVLRHKNAVAAPWYPEELIVRALCSAPPLLIIGAHNGFDETPVGYSSDNYTIMFKSATIWINSQSWAANIHDIVDCMQLMRCNNEHVLWKELFGLLDGN